MPTATSNRPHGAPVFRVHDDPRADRPALEAALLIGDRLHFAFAILDRESYGADRLPAWDHVLAAGSWSPDERPIDELSHEDTIGAAAIWMLGAHA